MSSSASDIRFPCEKVPGDAHAARLLGLYQQRRDGLWMQRVKVLGGRLTGGQWRALAQAARACSPAAPLHLTTRQDIEFHDLAAEAIGPLQRRIAEAGLTTEGACGDTLRNITVCPCSGAAAGSVDLVPLAWNIRRALEATEGITALPRKFKIALACGDRCGQPWINDLALVARRRDGRWGFRAIGAGSLGARPATGVELYEWVPPEDAVPLALAAVEVFAAHGDRSNRSRARLRHVRQRLGNDAFRKLLDDAFRRTKTERTWEDIALSDTADGLDASVALTFLNGDLTPEAADALGDLADRSDVRVRIANQHRVVLFGRSHGALHEALAELEALRGAAQPQPCIVACPGTAWCKQGLTDTRGLARRLHEQWANLPAEVTVCISGCPNGCAQSAVADIGLIGRVVTRDGKRQEAYDILAGGGMGRDDRLARLVLSKALLADASGPR